MRSGSVVLFIVISSLLLPISSIGKELSLTDIEKNLLEKKFKGYNKFVKSKKAYKIHREKKVEEHKLKRKRYAKDRKKRRSVFIKKKKSLVRKEVDIEAMVAIEKKKRDKLRNSKRLTFIQRRELMKKILKKSPRIPEDIDVGLKRYEELESQ